MAGANIPDIASDPEKGILKVRHSFSSKIHHDQKHNLHVFTHGTDIHLQEECQSYWT